MRTFVSILIFLAGCGTSVPTPSVEPEADTDTDTDADSDADTDTDADTDLPVTTFEEGFWLVTSLQIIEDTDLDDDGTVDNKLPEIIAAIDELMRDDALGVADINNNILVNMQNYVTVVFLDGRSNGTTFEVDVLNGFSIDGSANLAIAPSSFDEQGNAQSTLVGEFSTSSAYEVAGDLEMVVTMVPDVDPAPVRVESVTLSGAADPGIIEGQMQGIIPVDAFIEEVVASMIPDEGFEIFPGTLSTKDEILEIIRGIAPGLADATLPNGEAGVTAAFEVNAISWTLSP